ncbi:MAG: DUF1641 domain-containing protein [Candidatus Sericytochromatia bacterium]|nr:DUF1641 domain-containing protein [Candidatus Sericytochromatia bacterium]
MSDAPEPAPDKLDLILDQLQRLDQRLDTLEARFEQQQKALQEVPGMLAVAGNTLDELYLKLQAEGLDLLTAQEQLQQVGLTALEPQNLGALQDILQQLPALAEPLSLAKDMLGTVASLVNTLDGFYMDQIQSRPRNQQALFALLERVRTLEPAALAETAAGLHDAFYQSLAAAPQQPAMGVFALLKQLKDPEIQRLLAFALLLSRQLGQLLKPPTASKSTKGVS